MQPKAFPITVSSTLGEVSAEVTEVSGAKALMILAHGAGAGMNHRFMLALSDALKEHSISTLRYNFIYMDRGKKMPDPPAIAERTVYSVIKVAHDLYPDLPLFAGGKSFGGRMTSQLLSKGSIDFCRGIVFYGFPLHPEGKPDIARAEHLKSVQLPMLFLQGSADKLATLSLIQTVCRQLSLAQLKIFDGADHSFKAGKKEFIPELAYETNHWIDTILSISQKSK